MFPAKNSHHSPKTTQNKENKKRMFLCALNENNKWTAQSIQNSKFQLFFFFLFLPSLVSQSFKFLKPFIYFIHIRKRKQPLRGVCITASGNIQPSGNLCFRMFKLQLKVINKSVCYLYIAWVNQINEICTSISYALFISKFLAIY